MANDEKFAVGLSSGSSPRRQITSASFSLRTRGHCQRRPRTHSKYLVVFAAVGGRKRKSSRDFAGFRAKPHGDGESKARPSRALVAPALLRRGVDHSRPAPLVSWYFFNSSLKAPSRASAADERRDEGRPSSSVSVTVIIARATSHYALRPICWGWKERKKCRQKVTARV